MRPQSCKSKGRRLQQRVAASITEAFPHLAPDDVVSTSMGAGGEDVRMSPVARRALPLSIECKCQERLNVWACLEQARTNAPDGATPCLVFSRNRAPTYAVVPWPLLLDLFRRVHEGTGALPAGLVEALAALGPYVSAAQSDSNTVLPSASSTPDAPDAQNASEVTTAPYPIELDEDLVPS